MKKRIHPLEVFLMVFAALVLTSGAVALHTQSELADKVIRLHVLANSDSEADQALKLRVRDTVLKRATELLAGAESRSDAKKRLNAALSELKSAAERTVAETGYAYGMRVELAETAFPTREYDGFSLPAGEYLALRVLIGDAAGKNWWCVVFPPLCLGSVSETTQETALEAGLTENQVSLMTGEDEGYVVKFKAVELLEQFKGWLEGR
mgnify:CR=1 FL=1